MKNLYQYNGEFVTEQGQIIYNPEFVYHTYGNFDPEKSNVIWICHALTANSDPMEWWSEMAGPNQFFNPDTHFIICANYLGSCYGTTGPLSINIKTGKPWYRTFPEITVRDMVQGHELVRKYLGITKINTIIGGSIGGFQALEWTIMNPSLFENTVLIACNERSRPWAIALNESQRLAIHADTSFFNDYPEGGSAGLIAARSIALLSYRNGKAYNSTQFENDDSKMTGFKASSYQKYQGEKLVKRFNAYSYFTLTQAIDSHHVGRNRKSIANALSLIRSKTLVIGIQSDILFPASEAREMAELIPNAQFETIESDFGHDGFLIEWESLTQILSNFYNQ